MKTTDDTAAKRPDSPVENGLLLLVDGHAYAYRAFHAIRHLNSPSGSPTNAIYGFIKMLEKLESFLQPTHEAVIWDGGLAEVRLAALPAYKAQRPPMPEALAGQLDGMAAYLAAAGVVSVVQDGMEADDLIATAARLAVARGLGVVIASSDKDFMQLASDSVKLFNPADKSHTLNGPEQVFERTGVQPSQIVDWLALVGDSVDNIPGVPGVGVKTATALLQQFGTIEALLDQQTKIASGRLRDAIQVSREIMRRNQALIRLNDNVDMTLKVEDWTRRTPDRQQLKRLCVEWGFKSMAGVWEEKAQDGQQIDLL